MAIPSNVTIVGVKAIHIDDGRLSLLLVLSDGSTGATYWSLEDLHRFVGVVESSKHAPEGAVLQ